MPPQPIKREFAFTIMDVARLLKTYADQRARQFGISRAQWAVLMRIDRNEGLKQTKIYPAGWNEWTNNNRPAARGKQ